MKNILRSFFLIISCLLCLTACPYIATSSMVRTVGLGEEAQPLNARTFALESSINTIKATDYISGYESETDETIKYFRIEKSNEIGPSVSANFRLGLGYYTEIKLGVITGSVEQKFDNSEFQSFSSEVIALSDTSNTMVAGFLLGFKRLLTDRSEPSKVSLFFEGQHLKTSSKSFTKDYDGSINQFKSAILYGYVDPEYSHIIPNISLYYSLAHTDRKNTLRIPSSRLIQSIGGELNLNINYSVLYFNIYGGFEKDFGANASSSLIPYLGTRAGLRFDYSMTID